MIHTMKNIFKFITLGIALLAGTVAANAQTWNTEGGVSTAKTVSAPDENGLYTITLETYATGESSITETGIPVDIVLVLDVSGSMAYTLYCSIQREDSCRCILRSEPSREGQYGLYDCNHVRTTR